MVPNAANRLFGITELASAVASHLSNRDISRLLRTSRLMQEAMTLSLFRDLSIYSGPKSIGLWENPERLKVLARNMEHVRTWGSGILFLVYYYHAMVAYFDSNIDNNNSNNSISTPTKPLDAPQPTVNASSVPQRAESSSATPQLFSLNTRDAFELVPLPAMCHLRKACLNLCPGRAELNCRHYLPNFSNSRATIARLSGILLRLPQLRELELYGLLVRDSRSAQLLASTLPKMVNLKRLSIDISHENPFRGIKPLLYFSCPPSIEQFYIGETHYFNEEEHDDLKEDNDNNDTKVLEGSTRALTNLRDLTLDSWDGTETREKFLAVFEQCPRLETISMKWPMVPAGLDGSDIGKVCPNLRNISYNGVDDDEKDFWPIEIMETLPENQVKTLDYRSSSDFSLDEVMTGRTLLRHSRTLQRIAFTSTVSSVALRMILGSCEVLEEFNCGYSPIDLNDAAAISPWASSKITTLELRVRIPLPASPTSAIQYTTFYVQTPPVVPSADENRVFSQLEVFYREIGKQTNLKYLYLYAHQYESIEPEPTGELPKVLGLLPGVLTLKNNTEGRPGFLDLLGGLSKLERIGGDIGAETGNGRLAVDAKEVDWIFEHWSCLLDAPFWPCSRLLPGSVV
ncbi:hypothetical protein BGZ95_007259 [Linnemannia exigua]|uniref:F-box domain-containing protein n=1 Tax=Linnemannia exigua TaxID=604196 RepID=A0AAD4H7X7_9FUNG|nr:hypothetical protein BGZ95_007259 [Linnemannia exigua]